MVELSKSVCLVIIKELGVSKQAIPYSGKIWRIALEVEKIKIWRNLNLANSC